MQIGEAIGKAIKLVILASLVYYIFIDDPRLLKNLEIDIDDISAVPQNVTVVHTANRKLGDLGYTLLPQREFKRDLIYPVTLGIDGLKSLRLKEFEYYGFQNGDVYAKVIIRYV